MLQIVPRAYDITITEETDIHYLKYLQRKLHAPQVTPPHNFRRLDISLDDPEGDVAAGLAAWTNNGVLVIELLWVDDLLSGQGIGCLLVQIAEEAAFARGCSVSQVAYALDTAFYQQLGYSITAQLIQFPTGCTFYQLQKPLDQVKTDPYSNIAVS